MNDAAARLASHLAPAARRMVHDVRRALAAGPPDDGRMVASGRSLRLDDGCTGHAGLVLELPPHDTGPFADRDREFRIHVHDAALLARVGAAAIGDGLAMIVEAAAAAIDRATGRRALNPDHPRVVEGARHARALAFERSLAADGEAVATCVRHPWSGMAGAEGGPLPTRPLRRPLMPILEVTASWDGVDTDLLVEGLMHHASVRAADDPVGALRAVAELGRMRGG